MRQTRPRTRPVGIALALAFVSFACAAHHDVSSAGPDPGDAATADAASGPSTGPAGYGCRTDGSAGRICDFAHIAFRVTSLAAARAFYGDFLGLREPFPVSDKVAVYKIDDDQFIELHEEAPPAGDTSFQLKNIAFSTSDAEGLRRLFASKSIAVPAAVSKNILGNTSFTTADPDGHVVEWVQYEPDSLTGKSVGQGTSDTAIASSVHHLGVTITNPAAANAFYEGAVGFAQSHTADKDAARAPNADVRIEYGVTHSAPTKDFAVVRDHLCLRVKDTMKAVAALAARDPSRTIEHHVLDGFTVRANVFDPDGTRIELADSVLTPDGETTGPGDTGELDSGSSDSGASD